MTLGQERRSRGSGDFADLEGGEIGVSLFDGFGVCLALVLVRDLTRSARWYCERASLRFIREFTGDGAVRGAVLHDQDADFGIVLQDLSTVPGVGDLRSSRPVVLGAPSRRRCRSWPGGSARSGSTRAARVTDPDGTVVDVVDPNGIVSHVRHVTSPPDTGFQGVAYDADGTVTGTLQRRARRAPPHPASAFRPVLTLGRGRLAVRVARRRALTAGQQPEATEAPCGPVPYRRRGGPGTVALP
ncbi:hypothetical protein AB0N18_16090 [Streptomyces griseoincarnatus]